jgi:hypothetical protein
MARNGSDTATASFSIVIGDQPEVDFGGRRNPDGHGCETGGNLSSAPKMTIDNWRLLSFLDGRTIATLSETMTRSSGPRRIAPTDAPADAIERVLPRKRLQLVAGDVVVARERVPRVNPNPLSRVPQWHYRVSIHADPACERRLFHGFMHAAAAADQLAAELRSRVMFVEDGILSLLADYRPQP